MLFCRRCNSRVSADEAPVLRIYDECTRCHTRKPAAQQGLGAFVSVPPLAEQHAIVSALDSDGAGVAVLS